LICIEVLLFIVIVPASLRKCADQIDAGYFEFRSGETSSQVLYYCKGFIECPTTLSSFMAIQQGHFWSIHIAAWSCLHTAHIHFWFCILLNSAWRLDFRSTYNHKKTTGTPIAKNTNIVRMGILRTNRDIPKSTVPIPSVTSHLFVRLSIDNL
jgi:hypothetical protein